MVSNDNTQDPFFITGPALISFSGGRTSGYMLYRTVMAHGGTLPDDVYVAFANTGKEREETLDFVHECSQHFGVKVHWLEYRPDAPDGYIEVSYETASRAGEPFQMAIDKKKRLPNWRQRWCTALLKVDALQAFMRSRGYEIGTYVDVIGLRHDEGMRVLKGLDNAMKAGRMVAYPLSRAKVVKSDVMEFWAAQDFDLQLEPWEGNCDLCFLKGAGIKREILRRNPELAGWWIANETEEKGPGKRGWFEKRHSIAMLLDQVTAESTLPLTPQPVLEEYDVECGLTCAAEMDDDREIEAA